VDRRANPAGGTNYFDELDAGSDLLGRVVLRGCCVRLRSQGFDVSSQCFDVMAVGTRSGRTPSNDSDVRRPAHGRASAVSVDANRVAAIEAGPAVPGAFVGEACSLEPATVRRFGQVALGAFRNPLTGLLSALYPGGRDT
jgi:hypothetical protein